MTTTLLELRTDVRDRLNESAATTNKQWTDTMLTRWINLGLRDVARRAEVVLDRDDIAAVSGTQEYSLPSDLLRIYRVEYTRTGDNQIYPLEFKDFNNLDGVWWTSQSITEGTPAYFTTWGMSPTAKLKVYPTPSSAGSFKVFYYRTPTTLVADGDIAEIPEGWADIVVNYCEYVALRRDADPRWQEAKALYEQSLDDMMETTRRLSDQAGSIETYSGSFIPGWLYNDAY